MKKTLLTTAAVALGFSIAPAIAEDSAASEKAPTEAENTVSEEAATEAPAENTTTVFVVKFKGKG